MSRLFASESGFFPHALPEALSRRRWARKVFHLPRSDYGATLMVLAKRHPAGEVPLRLRFNDLELAAPADANNFFHWLSFSVPAGALRPGANTVTLWCDRPGPDGWAIGLEPGPRAGDSAVSLDGGQTWRGDALSLCHRLSGEYLVRLRLHDPAWHDPAPMDFVWEDPAHPLLAELRAALPADLREPSSDPWEQVLRLSTFVADHWAPVHLKGAFEYTPWDPFAIMSWVKAREGLSRREPVGFCVHGAVLFTCACLSLGLPARNYCVTPGLALSSGHFISEVWHAPSGQWRQVDAKCDLTYQRGGTILSVYAMHQDRQRLNAYTVPGPSYARQESHIHDFATQCVGTGDSYRHVALWPRNDYLSHPELTPPSHGTVAYCETPWQWLGESADGPLAMFPARRDPASLAAPPPAPWGKS